MIASIAVDLEDAVESFEYPLGMLAAAPRRVMIDHDGRIGAAMTAVVAPMPDEKQTPCLPPSSAARQASSAVRVGLMVRA